MLGPHLVQRFRDERGPDKGACGADEHGRRGKGEPLGDDHGAEVQFLTHQEVGPPSGAEREAAGCPLARDAAAKAVTDGAHVPLHMERVQRKPLWRQTKIRTCGEGGEPKGLDLRDDPRPSRKGDGVASGFRRAGDPDEWFQVASPTRECEENAHGGGPCSSTT